MTDDNETQKYISTALGHVCLLVNLLSKYLNISLLHKMKFQASTSKIYDGGMRIATINKNANRRVRHVYELCWGPNTEEMRLNRALTLLLENILLLCQARGVVLDLSDSALKSLQPLYMLLTKEALV